MPTGTDRTGTIASARPPRRGARVVRTVAIAVLGATAWAAPPCEALLEGFLVRDAVIERPCLVDLQERGVCFALEGTTLESSVRQFDAYLQTTGIARPTWASHEGTHATRVVAPPGDRVELVLAEHGPFATLGSCRLAPARGAPGAEHDDLDDGAP